MSPKIVYSVSKYVHLVDTVGSLPDVGFTRYLNDWAHACRPGNWCEVEVAAVNQERFDDLAKGLATKQLSRGPVLQGPGAALFAAALGINLQLRIAFAAKLCRTWVPRPGWNPMNTSMGAIVSLPSGCSPRMLQDMGTEADFTPPCNQHGVCYSTCNAEKGDKEGGACV